MLVPVPCRCFWLFIAIVYHFRRFRPSSSKSPLRRRSPLHSLDVLIRLPSYHSHWVFLPAIFFNRGQFDQQQNSTFPDTKECKNTLHLSVSKLQRFPDRTEEYEYETEMSYATRDRSFSYPSSVITPSELPITTESLCNRLSSGNYAIPIYTRQSR